MEIPAQGKELDGLCQVYFCGNKRLGWFFYWLKKTKDSESHFPLHVDGADARRQCRGDGFAAVRPGQPGRFRVRHAAPRGQAPLLRDHTYGRNEGSGEFRLNIKLSHISEAKSRLHASIHVLFFYVTQVVHDVSAEKLFLRDLVAAGAVTDLTGAL